MYKERLKILEHRFEALITRKNEKSEDYNGIYDRYKYPVLTAGHVPLNWRYDLNPETNPYCMERIGVNSTFNARATKLNNKYILMVRIEGWDRKSFFAVAESQNPTDNFRFWERPVTMPETGDPDINVYDMRLTMHQDGWIYGIFCTERKDPEAPAGDTSSAVAKAGIARTRDLKKWERLPDLVSVTGQQRNVVLHPEFVNKKYVLYTRPQEGFINVGTGGGIGLGYVENMENPVVKNEVIISEKTYHTVYELKNGLGPPPLKTKEGWLHLAHGVRNTAAGLRYVLYMFMTDLADISKIIYFPAGYLMAPTEEERVGDVSNVLFSNGWVLDGDGTVYIYYASSDTRMHVAESSIERLVNYVKNTPPDGFRTGKSVEQINNLIDKNVKSYRKN